eukprot:gene25059-12760_t
MTAVQKDVPLIDEIIAIDVYFMFCIIVVCANTFDSRLARRVTRIDTRKKLRAAGKATLGGSPLQGNPRKAREGELRELFDMMDPYHTGAISRGSSFCDLRRVAGDELEQHSHTLSVGTSWSKNDIGRFERRFRAIAPAVFVAFNVAYFPWVAVATDG